MIRELIEKHRNRRYDARYEASRRARLVREQRLTKELNALRVFTFEDNLITGTLQQVRAS
jgi:hypothetical protein